VEVGNFVFVGGYVLDGLGVLLGFKVADGVVEGVNVGVPNELILKIR